MNDDLQDTLVTLNAVAAHIQNRLFHIACKGSLNPTISDEIIQHLEHMKNHLEYYNSKTKT